VLTISKGTTSNFVTIETGPKPSSLKRVTQSQSNNFSSRLEPSSTGIKEQSQTYKKKVRDPNESAFGPNHEDPISVSKKIKKIGKLILGSPSNSGPISCGKKENTKVGKEQKKKKKKKKKIFPQSVVVNEIHSEAENDSEIPISFKENPRYEFKEEIKRTTIDTEVQEETKEKKFQGPEPKEKKTPIVLEMYVVGPHTRPSNKLRFKFNLMENPELKDMIINIDEEEIDQGEGKSSASNRRSSTRPRMRVSKVKGMRVSKAEGLKMLAIVLNTL
jgi:hypothetical protein